MRVVNATAGPYKAPSQKWLTERIDALAQHFRQELTPYEVKAYMEAWGQLATQVGESRLDTALKLCMRECGFFPAEAEIKRRIPQGEARAEHAPSCQCRGTGWLVGEDRRARRCKQEAEGATL